MEGMEGVADFDPEGLFKNVKRAGGHFARREAEREARLAGALDPAMPSSKIFGDKRPIIALPDDVAVEGIPAGKDWTPADGGEGYSRATMQSHMAEEYVEVDLDFPGLRVHSIDPPVFTLQGVFPREYCQALIQETLDSNALFVSQIGDELAGTAANRVSARRTSSSVLLDPMFLRSHPAVNRLLTSLHNKIREVLPGGSWDPTGWLPSPGRFCFESTQVARYSEGQHFLQHEDAFPTIIAERDRFQRRATFLLYLNDVAKGGGTTFDLLGLTIQPQCGKALLFFPALASGVADPRTLHTADGAVDEKWVTQQWVAGGLAKNVASTSINSTKSTPVEESVPFESKKAKAKARKDGNKGNKKNPAAARGFGKR
eukprot:CAMPEP_0196578076 /NCGR_PEP_ID=MMETSP1081-20130531/7050_1 /TAXON_ID=36882 /ORGANISM="Pyramimonas amylifera, Strain CCMP720" /LENGTH=371 /DNA_ID=CAMNT_0041897193 /DNA_START=294 /DNA_END=1409 /DNA_ORIENTATION=+